MNLNDIFIVIILYKTSLADSLTIQTLSNLTGDVPILVFDNSPEHQYELENFKYNNFLVTYIHDAKNLGLTNAYNFALEKATSKKSRWLLLLDQDTSFNQMYVDEICNMPIESLSEDIVAIIPNVVSLLGAKRISPTKISTGGFSSQIVQKYGVITEPISGINSGSLLSVDFMNMINGFDVRYSLDMVDHVNFREINKRKKKIYVLNSTVHQQLSVLSSLEESMTLGRYEQLLRAESLFFSEDNLLSQFFYRTRLLARAARQKSYKDASFFKLTIRFCLMRY